MCMNMMYGRHMEHNRSAQLDGSLVLMVVLLALAGLFVISQVG